MNLTNISTMSNPIGILLPFRRGKVGYFDQSVDTFTAYRMNIINLIRTKPGERRMNPTFGCHLWNVIFEQNDQFTIEKISRIIEEDIAQWIPGVGVSNVEVKYFDDDKTIDHRDTYKLYIAVHFIINSINYEDMVEIVLNTGKI